MRSGFPLKETRGHATMLRTVRGKAVSIRFSFTVNVVRFRVSRKQFSPVCLARNAGKRSNFSLGKGTKAP
jgi:hypothetical protein